MQYIFTHFHNTNAVVLFLAEAKISYSQRFAHISIAKWLLSDKICLVGHVNGTSLSKNDKSSFGKKIARRMIRDKRNELNLRKKAHKFIAFPLKFFALAIPINLYSIFKMQILVFPKISSLFSLYFFLPIIFFVQIIRLFIFWSIDKDWLWITLKFGLYWFSESLNWI